jgi:hypothetical protein
VRLREVAESQFVTVNRRLNPKIWHKDQLDPAVVDKLKQIAEAFEEFVGIDLAVTDYTITGSNANYTWTQYSDLDLHIIISGEVSEEARELFSAKKALWGEQHNITIKGLPVEVYIQGESEPHHSTGVFSIARNEWVEEPKKVKPSVDDASVKAKLDSVMHDVQTAILSKDIKKLRLVKEKLTKMRQSGLERAGEWSVENLVFKTLRNMGLIDQMTDLIRELEDQQLSLEQTNVLA